ncbi:MAG: hypothetical protein K2M87_05070 [Muribaculaceae bacterium]|nr:hypothetical protein [Muribaculaceae bacterium]
MGQLARRLRRPKVYVFRCHWCDRRTEIATKDIARIKGEKMNEERIRLYHEYGFKSLEGWLWCTKCPGPKLHGRSRRKEAQ